LVQRFVEDRLPPVEDTGLAVGALAELRNGKCTAGVFTLKRLVRR
jgi:hypothetical protein